MRSVFLILTVAACSVACSAASKPAEPAAPKPRDDGGVDVSLTTSDGVRLAATHWAGPAGNERCVIFAHQLNATREEWAPVIDPLRGRYELLAIDLRGHGGSRRGPRGELAWKDFDAAAWAGADRDLDAAMAFLEDRGFTTADCVVAGSSIGSTLAARFAGRRVDTAGVVLLSPGLDYKDLPILDAAEAFHGDALVVYSHEDAPVAVVDALTPLWGDRLQLFQVEGDAHGLQMLEADPGIVDIIANFIDGIFAD